MEELTVLLVGVIFPSLTKRHTVQLDIFKFYRILETQLVSVTSMTAVVNIATLGSPSRII